MWLNSFSRTSLACPTSVLALTESPNLPFTIENTVLVCLVTLVLVLLACNSPPDPFFACQSEAAEVVKVLLAYPATFDVHDGVETYSRLKPTSKVFKHRDGYWRITTDLVFGVKNAFGVPSNFQVFYEAHMLDGKCTIVHLGEPGRWDG